MLLLAVIVTRNLLSNIDKSTVVNKLNILRIKVASLPFTFTNYRVSLSIDHSLIERLIIFTPHLNMQTLHGIKLKRRKDSVIYG